MGRVYQVGLRFNRMLASISVAVAVSLCASYARPCQFGVATVAAEVFDGEARDIENVVGSLANANRPPSIQGRIPSARPVFSDDYDWDEQDRIVQSIEKILRNSDRALPALLKHVDDDRYCLTIRGAQHVNNASVGDICEMILDKSLCAAHTRHIPDLEDHNRKLMRLRSTAYFRGFDLPKWCGEKLEMNLALYELQVEICEMEIRNCEQIKGIPETAKQRFVSAVRSEIVDLRSRRKAVRPSSIFSAEHSSLYNERKEMK